MSVRSRTEDNLADLPAEGFFIPLFLSCLVGSISGRCASSLKSPGPLEGQGERKRETWRDRETGMSPLLGGGRPKASHFSISTAATNVARKYNI